MGHRHKHKNIQHIEYPWFCDLLSKVTGHQKKVSKTGVHSEQWALITMWSNKLNVKYKPASVQHMPDL